MKIYDKILENLSYFFCEYAFRMAGDGSLPLPQWHCPKWWRYAVNVLSTEDTVPQRLAQRWHCLMFRVGCYFENKREV